MYSRRMLSLATFFDTRVGRKSPEAAVRSMKTYGTSSVAELRKIVQKQEQILTGAGFASQGDFGHGDQSSMWRLART